MSKLKKPIFLQTVILEELRSKLDRDGLNARFVRKAEGIYGESILSVTEAGVSITLMPGKIMLKLGNASNRSFLVPDFDDPAYDPDFIYHKLADILQKLKGLQQMVRETHQEAARRFRNIDRPDIVGKKYPGGPDYETTKRTAGC